VNRLTDQQLLQDYAGHRSEPAFAELVQRHIDLVYSAALRMLRDPHLAEDVTQSVFVALAQSALELADHPVLSGWLHRTAQNLAANAVRTNVRRRIREQEAVAMNELLAPESDAAWEDIAPHLDNALGELNDSDRDALLLRYFERKSAREMAEILGVSDEAAQKRVSRGVDRLRELFAKRGVAVGASGLTVVITANAVQAAPSGLAVTISTAALAGTVVTTTAIVTTATAIAMTTLQKAAITVTLAIVAGAGIYEAHQASQLRERVQTLEQQQAPLADQIQQLQHERDRATNQVAGMTEELAAARKNPSEVLKLRGEVSHLRQENADVTSTSAVSKLTSNPETKKLIRDQQKMGMKAIYGDFTKRLNLSPEMSGKFNDLLADNVMDEIDLITQALHDGKSQTEVNQIFSAADAALQGKVQALLGDDAAAQYKDYTLNLASTLTAAQFAGELTGDTAAKQEKQNQLQQLVQQETAAALKNAGLPADYQAVPMLNFANIASEDQATASLNLLDSIYSNVAANSSSFLSPDEIASFQTFRTNAINNSRTVLGMNRKLMAPLSQ
jgi:RNA polymerase sigma factor (sigma-70 family)